MALNQMVAQTFPEQKIKRFSQQRIRLPPKFSCNLKMVGRLL